MSTKSRSLNSIEGELDTEALSKVSGGSGVMAASSGHSTADKIDLTLFEPPSLGGNTGFTAPAGGHVLFGPGIFVREDERPNMDCRFRDAPTGKKYVIDDPES